MNLHKLIGSGLPNVYLHGGVATEGCADDLTVTYADLDGLYVAITRALALCSGPMESFELRFLRKRLGMSQSQVAALGDKTEQAVAKWEKGTSHVPKAEASLLRLKAASRFGTRHDVVSAMARLENDAPQVDCAFMVFTFDGSKWTHSDAMALEFARERYEPVAIAAIATAMTSATTAEKSAVVHVVATVMSYEAGK